MPRKGFGARSTPNHLREHQHDYFVMSLPAIEAKITSAEFVDRHAIVKGFLLCDRLLDALSDYCILSERPLHARSNAAVDAHLDDLLNKCKAARAAIAGLTQQGYERLSSVAKGGANAQDLRRLRNDLTAVISAVHEDRRSRQPRVRDRGGAKPDHAMKQLLRELVQLYEDATRKQASVGKQGTKKYGGPFFRFACGCLELIELHPSNSAFGKALTRAIREHRAVPARKTPPRPSTLGEALAEASQMTIVKRPSTQR